MSLITHWPDHAYRPSARVDLLVATNNGAEWRSGRVLSRYYTELQPRYTVLLDSGAMHRECHELSMRARLTKEAA